MDFIRIHLIIFMSSPVLCSFMKTRTQFLHVRQLPSHVSVIINCGLNLKAGKRYKRNTGTFYAQYGTVGLSLLTTNISSIFYGKCEFSHFYQREHLYFSFQA